MSKTVLTVDQKTVCLNKAIEIAIAAAGGGGFTAAGLGATIKETYKAMVATLEEINSQSQS